MKDGLNFSTLDGGTTWNITGRVCRGDAVKILEVLKRDPKELDERKDLFKDIFGDSYKDIFGGMFGGKPTPKPQKLENFGLFGSYNESQLKDLTQNQLNEQYRAWKTSILEEIADIISFRGPMSLKITELEKLNTRLDKLKVDFIRIVKAVTGKNITIAK